MEIVGAAKLQEFWKKHAKAKNPLRNWWKVAEEAQWKNLVEIRQTYPSADFADGNTIFNIGGNKFRLVVVVSFPRASSA
ncbi:MAG: type II toxin-antitoxin system HigB family toxin [Bryobacterales bacterium]|nr:type II toxin-antitoxin system HigB family toxin [Bryobacterales bacterium]